ncbi:hypothetical protein DKX38_016364 [Salix brachista]|uniref:Uncharacterized protein n=1 Tax=Salix brachista TaxID=2182728 RepID=A0A5N5L9I4_9ROSI|nr:hypothetical protein DKX38_016364 [Salix brachista]
MKRKQILAYALLAFLVASQCHHSAGTVIQSAKSGKKLYTSKLDDTSVDSRLENAQPKFRNPEPCSKTVFTRHRQAPAPSEISGTDLLSMSEIAQRAFSWSINKRDGAICRSTMAGKREGPAIGIDLGTTYSCVGVWQHDRVEIIANDQGNRTTPSYAAFTDTERLIGDAAKNQVAMNPINTVFGQYIIQNFNLMF